MNFRYTHHLRLKQSIAYGSQIGHNFSMLYKTMSLRQMMLFFSRIQKRITTFHDGGSLLHRLKWTEGSTYSSMSDTYAHFTFDLYGKATTFFDGYDGGPCTKDSTHQHRTSQVTNKVNISYATKFVGKDDFLSNDINKQSLIHMIAERLQQKGCHVIYAEADADVDIVTGDVTMSSYKSTTLIGEATDLLVLLLYHGAKDGKDLYFRPDKGTPHVYNIRILKQLLVCFVVCDTTSQIFGVGKKSVFQKKEILSFVFFAPKADKIDIETAGYKAMVSLFNGTKADSLD